MRSPRPIELIRFSRQRQLVQALTGQPQVLRDLQHGRGVLGDLLRDRAAMLILDGVWSADHATPFNALGPRCRLLVATRDQKVLKQLQADDHCVDLLSHEQALELLARWAGTTTDDLPLLTAAISPFALRGCAGPASVSSLRASSI